MSITVDVSGAIKKTKTLLNIQKAAKKQVTEWSSESVKIAKRAASNLKKTKPKSGDMARNIGMAIRIDSAGYEIHIGTGVGGTKTVKYAKIQDEGGIIKAKGKYLTIPFEGVQGSARNFPDSFVIKSKAGTLLIVERKGKQGFRPLFTLKKQVTIPSTQWFSWNMDQRVPILNEAMKPEAVYEKAKQMAGV
ncbi:MAG: hypothetical protein WC347_01065 [Smithellaceae bacterium]|jgi:hypothetical protein